MSKTSPCRKSRRKTSKRPTPPPGLEPSPALSGAVPAYLSAAHNAPLFGAADLKIGTMSAAEFWRETLPFRWIRLPSAKEREPWTGLSRAKLNSLILATPANRYRPPVVSVSLRVGRGRRATRLISLHSLFRYIHSLVLPPISVKKHSGRGRSRKASRKTNFRRKA